MNEQLNAIITSAKARTSIYAALSILGLAYGATQVAFAAAHLGQPTWLTVAASVLAFLGAPIGGLAIANTPKASAPPTADPPAPQPLPQA